MSSTRKRAANSLLRPGLCGPMRCMGDLLAGDVRGSPPVTSVRQERAKGKNGTTVSLRPVIRGPLPRRLVRDKVTEVPANAAGIDEHHRVWRRLLEGPLPRALPRARSHPCQGIEPCD